MKKIGIDARFLGTRSGGIDRYTSRLLEYLEKDGRSDRYEFVVFLKREGFEAYHPKKKNFKKVLADFRWHGIAEQIFFPRLLYRYDLDIVHFCNLNAPLFYSGKSVVTVHDLIYLNEEFIPLAADGNLQRFFLPLKKKFYSPVFRFVVRMAINKSLLVLADSKFTKKDLTEKLSIPEKKIKVVYPGHDRHEISTKDSAGDAVLERYGIKRPFIFYVGGAYPHKNLKRLCLAFSGVKERLPELQLVLAGEKNIFYKELERFVMEKGIEDVNLTGFVSDEELGLIYKRAKLFVFPSLYEGFGIPPLDAVAKGVPVASSNRASLPEILGERADYFDPENIDSIRNSILEVLASEGSQRAIGPGGGEEMEKYSWKKMVSEVLDIYQRNV